MPDATLMRALERVFSRERRSFLRYLQEGASVTPSDEDAAIQVAVSEAHRDSDAVLEEIRDLLVREGLRPGTGSFNLAFTHYNYLRLASLLDPIIEHLRAHRTAVAGELYQLAEWPEGRTMVERLLRAIDRQIERFETLRRERGDATAG